MLCQALSDETPWTIACQAPLSREFFRPQYGVGCHCLHQGIFPTQGPNRDLLHCRHIIYHLRLQCMRPWFSSWVGKISWKRDRLPTPVFSGFPGGPAGKESACNVGDLGPIPGLGSFPGEGNSYPLQYSCLENPHGLRSLAGYSPWGHKELDMTE